MTEDSTPKTDKLLSRRQFIKNAAGVAAFGALAGWSVVPARALGRDGGVAASNRIVLGCIGVGPQGTGNMKSFLNMPEVQVVAVCDVDRERLDAARQMVDRFYQDRNGGSAKGCFATGDFREVLARPDIDAVMIATPDHWHALVACAAARAGKDIYCEKPLTVTIGEGMVLRDVVRCHGRVFQTGSWQRSVERFRYVCELVRNGRLGRLTKIEVGLPSNAVIPPQPVMAVPKTFDYDFWLGPALWAPYTKLRCHYNFRYFYDYSGGKITDWGAHHLDIVQWALGQDEAGPIAAEGHGDFAPEALSTTPFNYRCTVTYPGDISVTLTNQLENGIKFTGTEGTIFVSRERAESHPGSILTSVIAPEEIHLARSSNHFQNFVDCIRTRATTVTPVEVAHRSSTVCHLANLAIRLGRPLQWDPEHEHFVGDAQADRMITRAMRGPWQLS